MSGLPGSLIRYALPGCSAPCADLTGFPANGAFYFQAFSGSVALPAAGYNYNSDWTLLMGLAPIGMAASLAAPANSVDLTLYSITSSARASRVGGISRPSALAVIRLTARSNLVGCSTG